jgi:hypothetical protein
MATEASVEPVDARRDDCIAGSAIDSVAGTVGSGVRVLATT